MWWYFLFLKVYIQMLYDDTRFHALINLKFKKNLYIIVDKKFGTCNAHMYVLITWNYNEHFKVYI